MVDLIREGGIHKVLFFGVLSRGPTNSRPYYSALPTGRYIGEVTGTFHIPVFAVGRVANASIGRSGDGAILRRRSLIDVFAAVYSNRVPVALPQRSVTRLPLASKIWILAL
jgi:hypothetical protein